MDPFTRSSLMKIIRRVMIGLFLGMIVSGAKAEVAVRVGLVPQHAGPYVGGEELTIHVWLHSEATIDVLLELIQFDFSDTDPEITLAPWFTFDFSAFPYGGYYYDDFHYPSLPVPWIANFVDCGCAPFFLELSPEESVHIGAIDVVIPRAPGVYNVDVLNADDPSEAFGAEIRTHRAEPDYPQFTWRAFTGEIAGSRLGLESLGVPIPTVSEWGLVVMGLLLLTVGSLLAKRNPGSA